MVVCRDALLHRRARTAVALGRTLAVEWSWSGVTEILWPREKLAALLTSMDVVPHDPEKSWWRVRMYSRDVDTVVPQVWFSETLPLSRTDRDDAYHFLLVILPSNRPVFGAHGRTTFCCLLCERWIEPLAYLSHERFDRTG